MEDLIAAIDTLNDELYKAHGDNYDYEREYAYTTNGNMLLIHFGEILIHNSEDDDRDWIEDKDDYEPAIPYLKRMLAREVNKILECVFSDNA
jgi:hypothetical protein